MGKSRALYRSSKVQWGNNPETYDLSSRDTGGGSMCTITLPGTLGPMDALRIRARRHIRRFWPPPRLCVMTFHDDSHAGIARGQGVARGDRKWKAVIGPRILTSLELIEDAKLTPEQIREAARKLKADGADLVKPVSRSIRGCTRRLSDAATPGGVRRGQSAGAADAVHAYRDAVRAAAKCRLHRSGEHGNHTPRRKYFLDAMVEHGDVL